MKVTPKVCNIRGLRCQTVKYVGEGRARVEIIHAESGLPILRPTRITGNSSAFFKTAARMLSGVDWTLPAEAFTAGPLREHTEGLVRQLELDHRDWEWEKLPHWKRR